MHQLLVRLFQPIVFMPISFVTSDLPVKSAWSSQSRIDSIRSVCCSNNDKLASGFQTIKKS